MNRLRLWLIVLALAAALARLVRLHAQEETPQLPGDNQLFLPLIVQGGADQSPY
jgi:hypothetical protein